MRDLKKSASASEPIRQRLLFAFRDPLPKMFGPDDGQRFDGDRHFQRHVRLAGEALARD